MKKIFFLLLALGLLLSLCACGAAAPSVDTDALYEEALQRLDAQDFAQARELFTQAAEAGHADAMNELGNMYQRADGVAEDSATAFEWYKKAADAGSLYGKVNLAWCYLNGYGTGMDYVSAAALNQEAAEAGDPDAMLDLGYQYELGYGVKADSALAKEWYEKSAELGNGTAMNNMGLAYAYGKLGLEQNLDAALDWFSKAAAADCEYTLEDINDIAYGHLFGEDDWEQDYAIAREWYEKAYDLGDRSDAPFFLGVIYDQGWGMEQDYAAAAKWYEKGESASSAFNLGIFYTYGHGVDPDPERALEYFAEAAAREDEDADSTIFDFGVDYYFGQDSLEQDYATALRYFEKAAELGNVTAMKNVAIMYENGEGCEKDLVAALDWYTKAAASGDIASMIELGDRYRLAKGTDEDFISAAELYLMAADACDADDEENLSYLADMLNTLAITFAYQDSERYDPDRAFRYLSRASALGNSSATLNLAKAYALGMGVEKDMDKAKELLEASGMVIRGGKPEEFLVEPSHWLSS